MKLEALTATISSTPRGAEIAKVGALPGPDGADRKRGGVLAIGELPESS
jgi:hypothetical protein